MALSTAQRIPQEVLDLVLAQVTAFGEDAAAATTLRSATLVCRAWLSSAIKALYFDPTRWHQRWCRQQSEQFRDIVKSRPQLARFVRQLSKLATYHETFHETLRDLDWAGQWCWEIIKACNNVDLLEMPIRLQRSVVLAVEATNSLTALRHLVIKPSGFINAVQAAHEFVCGLRPVDNKLDTLIVSDFKVCSDHGFSADRPRFSISHFSVLGCDYPEFAFLHFFSPFQTNTLRSLDLEGYFFHIQYEDLTDRLQELAKLSMSTLQDLRIRTPSRSRRGPCRIDLYGEYHEAMEPSLHFSFETFFHGTLCYTELRTFKLEGFGFISTAQLSALTARCRLLETISFRDSVWDIYEWAVPETTCDDIRDMIQSYLVYLKTLHLGNLPILSREVAFRRVTDFCHQRAIDLDYVPCLDEPPFPRFIRSTSCGNESQVPPAAARLDHVSNLEERRRRLPTLPSPMHFPEGFAPSSDGYSGYDDDDDDDDRYLDSRTLLPFDDPRHNSRLAFSYLSSSASSNGATSPLCYVPSSPWIPRLAEGYEAKDDVDDEEPWENWIEACDIEKADERWRAGD